MYKYKTKGIPSALGTLKKLEFINSQYSKRYYNPSIPQKRLQDPWAGCGKVLKSPVHYRTGDKIRLKNFWTNALIHRHFYWPPLKDLHFLFLHHFFQIHQSSISIL